MLQPYASLFHATENHTLQSEYCATADAYGFSVIKLTDTRNEQTFLINSQF
jgi:hypothetical protein